MDFVVHSSESGSRKIEEAFNVIIRQYQTKAIKNISLRNTAIDLPNLTLGLSLREGLNNEQNHHKAEGYTVATANKSSIYPPY